MTPQVVPYCAICADRPATMRTSIDGRVYNVCARCECEPVSVMDGATSGRDDVDHYRARRSVGGCVNCSAPAAPGRRMCLPCGARDRACKAAYLARKRAVAS